MIRTVGGIAITVARAGTPHLMFHAPYLTNEDITSFGEEHATHSSAPLLTDGAKPNAHIVVLTPTAPPAAIRA